MLEKRLTGEINELTAYEIAEAFPECKRLINKIILEIDEDTEFIRDYKYEIEKDENISEFGKIFINQVINIIYIPKHLKKLKYQEKLMQVKNILKNKNKKGNINSEDISKAKDIKIESLYNGKLKKTGRTLTGLCPFHFEKTGSFSIYIKDNKYKCFGCGKHGDSINYIMEEKGYDFINAVKYLIKQ